MFARFHLLLAISTAMLVSSISHVSRLSRSFPNRGRSASYTPGLHVVQLPELGRQFVLAVPEEAVDSPDGVPLLMAFHGGTDSPWYLNRMGALSTWLNRYGWIGIFPFGLNSNGSNGLGGVGACCHPKCDEECCMNGFMLAELGTDSACSWPAGPIYPVPDRPAIVPFVQAMVEWAGSHMSVDATKVFATGFSAGGFIAHYLGCHARHIFRAVAPIETSPGDALAETCQLDRPISYISFGGNNFDKYREEFAKLSDCIGDGPAGEPITEVMSATTRCTLWSKCAKGNFVEACETLGLPHDISGHLRPDNTSFLRPGSDHDAIRHIMQKFSILASGSILFYGQPSIFEALANANSPTVHHDHLYLREGRLLGADFVVTSTGTQ